MPTDPAQTAYLQELCLGYEQYCARLPEQPNYYNFFPITGEVGMGGPVWTSYLNPWGSFSSNDLVAVASASACGNVWSTSLNGYYNTAPLVPGWYSPAFWATYTQSATVSTETSSIPTGSEEIYTTATVTGYEPNYQVPTPGSWTSTYTNSLETLYSTSLIPTSLPMLITSVGYDGFNRAKYASDFTFKPTSPCCSACTITAGEIKVMYWPHNTTVFSSGTSTYVDSVGFTL